MTTHCKKIKSEYFSPVLRRIKNFELRKDSENYQVGDVIVLMEFENNHYTGRTLRRHIKYVLRNVPEYGLQEGYCIIGW